METIDKKTMTLTEAHSYFTCKRIHPEIDNALEFIDKTQNIDDVLTPFQQQLIACLVEDGLTAIDIESEKLCVEGKTMSGEDMIGFAMGLALSVYNLTKHVEESVRVVPDGKYH